MSSAVMTAIEQRLRQAPPPPGIGRPRWRAAVAVVLREVGGDIEVLLIRRAEREGDRWSGDAALPGGRADTGDPSLVATAIREAREEVGLELAGARVLGRLGDHPRAGVRPLADFAVTPVLFEVVGDPALVLDPREVAATCWVPLSALRGRAHRGRMVYWWRPLTALPLRLPLVLPVWRYRDLTIWGLTHSILRDVVAVAGA